MLICNRQVCCCCVVAAFGVLLSCGIARGEFTTINPTTHSNEDDHHEILSHIYGGTFVPVAAPASGFGVDFTNGTILARRIHDRLNDNLMGSALMMGGGPAHLDGVDQLWNGNFTIASAEAKFALFDQAFGYYEVGTITSSPPTFQQLFTVDGFGYEVDETADLSALAGKTIRWARRGGPDDPNPREFSSRESDNIDGVDHMVTYEILDGSPTAAGDGGLPVFTYLMFWEDKFFNEGDPEVRFADFDFNDLVIEVKAVIPEPTTSAVVLAALGAVALRRRRRVG